MSTLFLRLSLVLGLVGLAGCVYYEDDYYRHDHRYYDREHSYDHGCDDDDRHCRRHGRRENDQGDNEQ